MERCGNNKCKQYLSESDFEEGVCSECGYEFNPIHRTAATNHLYKGTVTLPDGQSQTVLKMAEQLVSKEIIYRFGQFAITDDGIECLVTAYSINKTRLSEQDWIKHMEEKSWVNMADFKKTIYQAESYFK